MYSGQLVMTLPDAADAGVGAMGNALPRGPVAGVGAVWFAIFMCPGGGFDWLYARRHARNLYGGVAELADYIASCGRSWGAQRRVFDMWDTRVADGAPRLGRPVDDLIA
jgi:hypothetical protein